VWPQFFVVVELWCSDLTLFKEGKHMTVSAKTLFISKTQFYSLNLLTFSFRCTFPSLN
jgi:hypothetical protein